MHELMSKTLGDTLADFGNRIEEFAALCAKQPLDWDKLHNVGYQICDLSQWIHLEISTQHRLQEILCDQASELMKRFVDVAQPILQPPDKAGAKEMLGNLELYVCHVEKRARLLAEMGRRREQVAAEFGLRAQGKSALSAPPAQPRS